MTSLVESAILDKINGISPLPTSQRGASSLISEGWGWEGCCSILFCPRLQVRHRLHVLRRFLQRLWSKRITQVRVKISCHDEVDAMSLFSRVALMSARVLTLRGLNLGLEAPSVFFASSKQSILFCSKGHEAFPP